MRIQKISSGAYYNNNTAAKKNNIAFTSDMESIDIGASNPKGNARVRYMDKRGNTLFSYKSHLNYDADKFQNNDDFNTRVAELIDPNKTMTRELNKKTNQLLDTSIPEKTRAKLEAEVKELENNLGILKSRTAKQKELRGIAVFLPATLQGKRVLIMPNLRDVSGNSLENVELKDIITKLQENGNVKLEKNFNPEVNFIPLKDLAATGVTVTKKVMDHPELSKRFDKGFCMSVVQPGGGWGVTTVELNEDDIITLRTSESGHDVYYDYKTKKAIRYGENASVPAVIKNYAQALGITDPDELKAVKATGLAHMSTQKQIDLSSINDKKAIDALMKTEAYELVNAGSEITTLRIKDAQKFEKASMASIKAFADAIACHAITRINRGYNLLALSGPLTMGLDAKLKEHPIKIKTMDSTGAVTNVTVNNMVEAVWARIYAYKATDNTVKLYIKEKNFEIVCDKALSAVDNNESGAFFLSGETKTIAKRGERVTIPKDVISNLSKYTDPSFVELMKRPVRKLLKNMLKAVG